MLIKEIENYSGPKILKKKDFFSANNIVSVISAGLLTFTLSCSSNVKIVENNTNSSDSLLTNYPNPFMPTTTIEYKVKNITQNPDSVKVMIYDINGNIVKTLFSGLQQTGSYKLTWNGKDENDESVESGVYFYKIVINGKGLATKKMLLMK